MIIPLDTSRWMPKEDQRVVQTIGCCKSNVRRESLKCGLLGYVYSIPNGFLAGTKTIPDSPSVHTYKNGDFGAQSCVTPISKVESHKLDRCSH